MPAIELLLNKGISGAPIVDRDYNLIGLLSEKNAIQALLHGIYDRLPTPSVGSVIRVQLTTVTADCDLLTIAHLFTKTRLAAFRLSIAAAGGANSATMKNPTTSFICASPPVEKLQR